METVHRLAENEAVDLADLFWLLVDQQSDIRGHMEYLSNAAMNSGDVVELGVRGGVSTICFLHGLACRGNGKLRSYDLNQWHAQEAVEKMIPPGVDFKFEIGDSSEIEIDQCNTLFIDTRHDADLAMIELRRHQLKVNQTIIMHDTETFGINGETKGPGNGLKLAIGDFLIDYHAEWEIFKHATNDNGLTTFNRCDFNPGKLSESELRAAAGLD